MAHPLAHATIQVELARLMVAKAAALYDAGRDLEAGVAANMAKYATSEAATLAVDTAIQVHGGNGMTTEYGVATLLGGVRAGRIAPVEPRDDPQLRGHPHPRPGQVLLIATTSPKLWH